MNAAKLLRQKILDLAIRGKLTNREKDDEPAAALLARIAAEKQKLIAAKKIKKEKPLPPITEDEKPFDVPKGWEWSRLKEITDSRLLNDGDWILSDDMVEEGPVKLLQLGSVGDGVYRNKGFKYLTEERFRNLGCTLIHEGYLLINRMIGDSLLACLMPKIDGKVITAVDICWVSPSERYDVKFLMYVVLSPYFQKAANDLGAGEGRVRVSKGNLTQISIPLPPLAEQHRIVSRVEELLAEVDKYSAAMDTLASTSEMMEKKVLDLAIRGKLTKREKGDDSAAEIIEKIAIDKAELVAKRLMRKEKSLSPIGPDDEPFDLPKGWIWCRFGELCAYGQCESVSFAELPKNTWALDLEEIEKDTGRLLKRKLVKDKLATSGKHLFKNGMLLYSKLRTYLNKVLIADQDGVCTSEIIPIDFHGFVDAAYARIVLMSPYFLSYTASKDYGVKMPRVSTDDMRMAAFPLPPLAEQHRIVARVDELLAECRKMRGE